MLILNLMMTFSSAAVENIENLLCKSTQGTEVRLDSLSSGGFITAIVANQLERRLAKRTSVRRWKNTS